MACGRRHAPHIAERQGRLPMITITQQRKLVSCAALVALIVALGVGQALLQNTAEAQRTSVQAPMFEVDPFWPKPFSGLLGMAIGVWVDDQDYVWIIHRSSATLHNNEKGAELNPPIAECCRGAPPVLAFDPDGNLVRAWGGPGPAPDCRPDRTPARAARRGSIRQSAD